MMTSWYIESSFTVSARPSAEEVPYVLQPLDQCVDLGRRGVQIERRSRGRGNSVPEADGPRAVVTDTDRDALFVEDLAHVVRVDVAEREGDRRAPVLGRGGADDPEAGDLRQALDRVLGERVLVGEDLVHADRLEIVDGRAQTDRLRDRRGARLELVRRRGVRRRVHRHGLDHLAAAQERRQVLQELLAAPQHADAGRAAHLVTGEGHEVGLEGLYVQRHVRRGLRGVDADQGADLLRPADYRLDRVDRAQDVGHQHEGDDLRLLGDDLVDVGQVEPAVVGQAEP